MSERISKPQLILAIIATVLLAGVVLLATYGPSVADNAGAKGDPEAVDAKGEQKADPADEASGHLPADHPVFPGEPFVNVHTAYAMDASNDQELCGASSNVFMAEIKALHSEAPIQSEADSVTNEAGPPIPARQYVAKVVSSDVIKGQIPTDALAPDSSIANNARSIVIQQEGGRVNATDPVELVNGDPLLVPNKRYFFNLRYDADKKWFIITAQPAGDIPVTSGDYSESALESRFTTACQNEVANPMDTQADLSEDEPVPPQDADTPPPEV